MFPETVGGIAATVVPYAVVNPYSKLSVTVRVFGFTLPFSVAVVPVIDDARVVTKIGGGWVPVKVPNEVRPFALSKFDDTFAGLYPTKGVGFTLTQ